MLFSVAIVLLIGLFFSFICKKIHLPPLLGMLIAGMLIGPYGLNWIDDALLHISLDLREIALIIILARAGLTLNIQDLKKVGRPAILLCFMPAIFEIGAMMLLGPLFFNISILEAGLMGSIVAAVSPAVIVPKMIKIIEEGYGTKKSIPQMILAGASVDDVFVIVLFTVLLGMVQGNDASVMSFVNIPLSIISGIFIGALIGYILSSVFKKNHMRDSIKVLVVLSTGFLLVAFEDSIKNFFSLSSLIAIMSLGTTIKATYSLVAKRISTKFSKLWVFAEIILFVLVGAAVNIQFALNASLDAVLLLFSVLVFRMLGVFLCVLKTSLTRKERMFCMFAYIPKATVQAAIGGIPLAMGLSSGDTMLTIAVIAILITAPLGASLIEFSYKKFLQL